MLRSQVTMTAVLVVGGLLGWLAATGPMGELRAQDLEPQPAPPKYKADPPPGILTPNKVDTKLLGTLEYFDGMPSKETVAKANDFLIVARGVEAFMSGMPAASLYAAIDGQQTAGSRPGDLLITETMMDARMLFLTPNTTTPYCILEIDVKKEPIVVEIPPGVLGPVQDAMFRYVTDFGLVGPDQGRGGK